ncbi:MAG TPA: OmpA family protein [Cyclobacteriaceae bacterium]|nr:OmpA family protein [Cyclobacteriaceae bacterium]
MKIGRLFNDLVMRIHFLVLSSILSVSTFAQLNLPSPENINSPFDEQNAVISPDGKTIYFTIANHPGNVGGKRDPGDIWISHLMDGHWTTPVHGGKVLNDAGYNGIAGFSQDGSRMFLLSHYATSGSGLAKTQGIAVSKNNSGDWSKPENIAIPYFQNKSSIVTGCISLDSRVFVYSAETYGSYGVEDLYVTLKDSEGNWSAPKNLGASINTQFQEVSPSLSTDGKTLYFSTNGRKGSGSFDVYSTTRLDDSWTNWSDPINLGSNVNTDGRDLFFRTYPGSDKATYASTTNSDGYGDIKLYTSSDIKSDEPPVIDQPVEPIADIQQVPAEKGLRIFGKITNAKTGEPITGIITITGVGEDKNVTCDANGYRINLDPQSGYTVRIESSGFISAMEKLDVEGYAMETLELNWKLQPVERGTTVNLKSVLFEQSEANLLPESYPELDLVVDFLQNNPTVTIELSGHTDNRGVASDNIKLSQDRVETVREYLISKGIEARRITGKGYGGMKPIASNDTEETRKLNRRVEFTIKKM